MDAGKTGRLIAALRRERAMTQKQLAQALCVSDKAVSKWERGRGCPEVSLLPALSAVLQADLAALLSGEAGGNQIWEGNMKRIRYYVCPDCGNLLTATADAGVACCGRTLQPLAAQTPDAAHQLTLERVEDELFVTSAHPMEKGHYVAFAAVQATDTLLLRRCYPEWTLQLRLPPVPGGTLLWYCTRHGLFAQPL